MSGNPSDFFTFAVDLIYLFWVCFYFAMVRGISLCAVWVLRVENRLRSVHVILLRNNVGWELYCSISIEMLGEFRYWSDKSEDSRFLCDFMWFLWVQIYKGMVWNLWFTEYWKIYIFKKERKARAVSPLFCFFFLLEVFGKTSSFFYYCPYCKKNEYYWNWSVN